ncbi:MAG: alanine dehydrogenase [Anaerolineae bacterium]|nr:alanine dehydrogenase [Anaerolineae bacterium]
MEIGIPAERNPGEYRVGLTPQWVRQLTQEGNRCYVEHGAGQGAGFQDADYERAGARVVYDAHEVWARADLVLKVGSPTLEEADMVRPEQAVAAFWHLAARPREVVNALLAKHVTAVSYELIQLEDGVLPVLHSLSEIAGRMIPQVAARLLQNDAGGAGELLGGVAGIPASDIVIIGAGTVGLNAAQAFLGLGARVIVLDTSLARLRYVDERLNGQAATMMAYDYNVARVAQFANVLVGAVLVPGQRAPIVVTRDVVRTMRPHSLIMDVSIDQGGCVETSRPTTHDNPTFIEEGVVHYCVPNMPGVVARTATYAYLNAAWPYIHRIVREGVDSAVANDSALRQGVCLKDGKIYRECLATMLEGA